MERDKMLHSALNPDKAFSLPQPVCVKLDRMKVRQDGSKETALIYYVEFFSSPMEYSMLEPAHFESVVSEEDVVQRGHALYRAGSECKNIFVVRSGSFKSVLSNGNGLTQITGFRMTGELLGLGGLSTGHYECDAIALEDSTVCVVPLSILEQACHHTMIMQCHVNRLFGREIARGANLMRLLGTMNSEQRVATFLVDLSTRLRARGYSATEFRLRMTRGDICSFLGISRKTLNHVFSRLHEKRLVDTSGDQVQILNLAGLASLC